MKRVLTEAILVACIGAVLSFAANAISPRRLNLSRNYFPPPKPPPAGINAATNGAAALVSTNTRPQSVTERLQAEGLTAINSNRVAELFQDPRASQQLVIFVDARDDEHYRAGHIPAAYQLDYYRFEKYLPAVLPACQGAEQVVVYCNGGDCEDSALSARLLRDAGIPLPKLLVYTGGMSEWSTNSMPIESGDRGSGLIRNAAK